MNPDFAIILNFKLKNAKYVDTDFLVKIARDIGARAIATNLAHDQFKNACIKYTIALVKAQNGLNLTTENAVDTMVQNRKKGKSTFINVELNENNTLTETAKNLLAQVNSWMHLFGHAFNESEPRNLSTDSGFVLQNRHQHYQKYLFIKRPLPAQVEISGITNEPNRIEMVEKRTEPNFVYVDDKLTIDLTDVLDSGFDWQILRIQEHRPEDDIKETKF